MGTVLVGLAKALSVPCHDCSKYVFNSMHCHSRCSQCCDCDVETHEVAGSDSDSEIEVDCLGNHVKYKKC